MLSLLANELYSRERVGPFGQPASSDGEGEWAVPSEPLRINSLTNRVTVRRWRRGALRACTPGISEKVRRSASTTGARSPLPVSTSCLDCMAGPMSSQPETGSASRPPGMVGQPVDPDLTILLAWQIAEGHEDKYAVAISQKNVAVLESLLQCMRRLGDTFQLQINRPAIRASANWVASLRITSADYRGFVADLGYDGVIDPPPNASRTSLSPQMTTLSADSCGSTSAPRDRFSRGCAASRSAPPLSG